jgi:hypothetical protein
MGAHPDATQASTLEAQALDAIMALGGIATIDEVIVSIYRMTGRLVYRGSIRSTLHAAKRRGLLRRADVQGAWALRPNVGGEAGCTAQPERANCRGLAST